MKKLLATLSVGFGLLAFSTSLAANERLALIGDYAKLQRLSVEMRGMTSWQPVFSVAAVEEFSRRLALALEGHGNPTARFSQLAEGDFRDVFDAWRQDLVEGCRLSPCPLAEALAESEDLGRVVAVDVLTRARFFLASVYPFLSGVLQEQDDWTAEGIRAAASQAIQRYAVFERDRAVVLALAEHPELLELVLGTGDSLPERLLEAADRLKSDGRDFEAWVSARADQGILEAERAFHAAHAELIEAAASRISDWMARPVVAARMADASRCLELFSRRLRVIDFNFGAVEQGVAVGLDEGHLCAMTDADETQPLGPFLRLRMENGQDEDESGSRVVDARLYLVKPAAGEVDGAEEHWLGFTVHKLAQSGDGTLRSLEIGLTNVTLDRDALVSALHALGVPRSLTIVPNAEVEFPDGWIGPGRSPRLSVVADLEVPGLSWRWPLRFEISDSGLNADLGEDFLVSQLQKPLVDLYGELGRHLAGTDLGYPEEDPRVQLSDLRLISDQEAFLQGDLRIGGSLKVLSRALPVELQVVAGPGRDPELRLSGMPATAEIVRELREQLMERFAGELEAARAALVQSGVPDFFLDAQQLELLGLSFDPRTAMLRGSLVLAPGGIEPLEMEVQFDVAEGEFHGELNLDVFLDRLEARALAWVKDYAEQAAAQAANEALRLFGLDTALRGDRLVVPILGYRLEIWPVRAAELEVQPGRPPFEGFDFSNREFALFRGDESEAIGDGWKQVFVESLDGIPWISNHLVITDADLVRSGLRIDFALKDVSYLCAAGATCETPAGSLLLTPAVQSFDVASALKTTLRGLLDAQLAAAGDFIPNIGPFEDGKPDISADLKSVSLVGKLALWEGVKVDMTVPLLPVGPPIIDEAAAVQGIMGLVGRYLKLPDNLLGDLQVQPKTTAPYGVFVSGPIDIAALLGGLDLPLAMDLQRTAITTRGVELPETLTADVAGFIATPSGIAFVNPRITYSRKTPAGIGLGADVTLAPEGTERVARIESDLFLDFSDLTMDLDGVAVVADALPVFQVEGFLDAKNGIAHFSGETIGEVRRIIDIEGEGDIDAGRKIIRASGSYSLLGAQLWDASFSINDPKGQIGATGIYRTPLSDVNLRADLKTDLTLIGAAGGLSFGVAGHEIAGASLSLAQSVTSLEFDFSVFDVTVRAPGPANITKARISAVLLSLLDFDVDLLKLIKDRKIEISLFNESGGAVAGGAVGSGDPETTESPESAATGDNEARQEGAPDTANQSAEAGDDIKTAPNESRTANLSGTQTIRSWTAGRTSYRFEQRPDGFYDVYETSVWARERLWDLAVEQPPQTASPLWTSYHLPVDVRGESPADWELHPVVTRSGQTLYRRPVWLFFDNRSGRFQAWSLHLCDGREHCPMRDIRVPDRLLDRVQKHIGSRGSGHSRLTYADRTLLRLVTQGQLAPRSSCPPQSQQPCIEATLSEGTIPAGGNGEPDVGYYLFEHRSTAENAAGDLESNDYTTILLRSQNIWPVRYDFPKGSALEAVLKTPQHKAHGRILDAMANGKPLRLVWAERSAAGGRLLLAEQGDESCIADGELRPRLTLYAYDAQGQAERRMPVRCHDWELYWELDPSLAEADPVGVRLHDFIFSLDQEKVGATQLLQVYLNDDSLRPDRGARNAVAVLVASEETASGSWRILVDLLPRAGAARRGDFPGGDFRDAVERSWVDCSGESSWPPDWIGALESEEERLSLLEKTVMPGAEQIEGFCTSPFEILFESAFRG